MRLGLPHEKEDQFEPAEAQFKPALALEPMFAPAVVALSPTFIAQKAARRTASIPFATPSCGCRSIRPRNRFWDFDGSRKAVHASAATIIELVTN
jgi:hypothetical protein